MTTIPHVSGTLDEPSIVTPAAFAQHHGDGSWHNGLAAPEVAIMLYHRGLAEHMIEQRDAIHVPYMFADHFLLDSDGAVALVANFGIGAPSATLVMEDLIHAGVHTIISVGTSGALQPELTPGEMVLVTDAIRDEGTSHHYAPPTDAATATDSLVDDLAGELERATGTGIRRGTAWTTDAPYRETALEIAHYRDTGVLCVEMELAALYTVARLRGVDIAGVLTVSDVLHERDWTPEFHGDATMRGLEAGVEAAIAVARRRSTRIALARTGA